ncbi:MAG TPA: protein kinase [Candidatus Polarisedimenticolia bacterium]|nr:protein kinase [Candidatus Polarisedimenticolia bacterium]
MTCPSCGRSHEPGARRCDGCGALLGPDARTGSWADAPTEAPSGAAGSAASGARAAVSAPDLGPRYQILSVLGEGGMGTVYKARDRELDRLVALKVIRPDLASRPEIVDRFKREILLASQVTHKNVLRIHDLGEAGEVRFISMQYVEGSNLAYVLRRDAALPLERALPLVRQMVEALQAAHDAGVVHRDLKPQNILIDESGHPYIADFGISRSIEAGSTMTDTGAVIGTIDYMSPEQARGDAVDHRSDLYSLGVILYEIFTGSLPFQGSNSLSVMMKRITEDAPSIRQARPQLPAWLSAIVARAMQRDPAARYGSAAELLRDLDRQRAAVDWKRSLRRRLPAAAGLAAGLIVIAAGTNIVLRRPSEPAAAVAVRTSLAVLPFVNATGDPRYDWVGSGLPDLLRSDLMQSRALRLVGAGRLEEVLDGLALDGEAASRPDNLRRIALLTRAENLLTARLMKAGDQFRLEAGLTPAEGAGATRSLSVKGEGESQLFAMIDDLTRKVEDELGLARGWGERRRGAADLSTSSVEALRLYGEGLKLAREGNDLEAAGLLEKAVEADKGFAMAHALLAETYARLGYGEKAAGAAAQAADGLAGTSEYEAARIRGVKARLAGRRDEAVAAYHELAAIAPNNPDVHLELSSVLEDGGDLEGAESALRRVLALDEKHPGARYALGRVLVKLGRSADAIQEMNAAIALHVESGNEEGRATALNGLGNALSLMAQYDDALSRFEQALEIRRRIGDQRGVRATLTNIARLHGNLGRHDRAVAAAGEAIAISESIKDRRGLAEGYLALGDIHQEAGRASDALKAYQDSLDLMRGTGDEAITARLLSSIGYINTVLGRYVEATYFHQEALARRRAIGDKRELVLALGDTMIAEQLQGRYDEAVAYAIEGQALAREIGSQGNLVNLSCNLSNIHEDQGRYAAALAALEEAIPSARSLGDPGQLAACLAYLGSTRVRLGDPAGAAGPLAEARALAEEAGSPPLMAEILMYEGDRLRAAGSAAEALPLYARALESAEASEDRRLLLMAQIRRAEASSDPGGLAAAAQAAGQAKLAPLVAPARLALARLLLERGKGPQALAEVRRALAVAERLGQRDAIVEGSGLMAAAAPEEGAAALRAARAALLDMTAGLTPSDALLVQRGAQSALPGLSSDVSDPNN